MIILSIIISILVGLMVLWMGCQIGNNMDKQFKMLTSQVETLTEILNNVWGLTQKVNELVQTPPPTLTQGKGIALAEVFSLDTSKICTQAKENGFIAQKVENSPHWENAPEVDGLPDLSLGPVTDITPNNNSNHKGGNNRIPVKCVTTGRYFKSIEAATKHYKLERSIITRFLHQRSNNGGVDPKTNEPLVWVRVNKHKSKKTVKKVIV